MREEMQQEDFGQEDERREKKWDPQSDLLNLNALCIFHFATFWPSCRAVRFCVVHVFNEEG